MVEQPRYLGIRAGPFRLALPLEAVRQILDVGGDQPPLTSESGAEGAPVSLAKILGAAPGPQRPARIVVDAQPRPLQLTVCVLDEVFPATAPRPLPRTVACGRPGLVHGVVDDRVDQGGLRLVLNPHALAMLVDEPRADP